MPTSSNDLKSAIFEHIRTMVLEHLPQRYKILDVGPGIGTYGMNLSDLNIDAIEIHEPYVEQYGIRKYYGNVFIGDTLILYGNQTENNIIRIRLSNIGDALRFIERIELSVVGHESCK